MSKNTYIFRRNSSYYIRIIVPSDLYSIFGAKPLVLVEGKSDIKYIKRALELYKEFPSNYNFISFNGTGNAHYFYNETQEYLQNRKVIILLDRDEAGVKALGTFTNQNMKDRKWQDYMNDDNIYKKNNLTVKRLTKNNPTMAQKFAELKNEE